MLQNYLERIKQSVLSELAGENVAIALFGSAAVGEDTVASDVDIAVIPRGSGISVNCLYCARNWIN